MTEITMLIRINSGAINMCKVSDKVVITVTVHALLQNVLIILKQAKLLCLAY